MVYGLLTSFASSEVISSAFFVYDGVYADDLRSAGVEVITLGKRTPVLWRMKRFLGVLLLPWLVRRFDVIHAHSTMMAPMALAAKFLGARVVFHLHEKSGKKGALLHALIARADKVVFCAENCALHYKDIPACSSATILNAVRIPDDHGGQREARSRNIVMLGSINRNKGQDILVKAFAALRPEETELRLYGTVGLSARGYIRDLRKFVAENRLEGSVLFPGPTQDAPDVFRKAYLLVHSSLDECLSMSILEAMAHGVPVIANDIAGMREIIEDGVNGFLVTPGDVKALADRIALLLNDAELWQQLSAAGRATVGNRFDMRVRVREFVRIYCDIMMSGAQGEGGA